MIGNVAPRDAPAVATDIRGDVARRAIASDVGTIGSARRH